jgi:hypothetical protein
VGGERNRDETTMTVQEALEALGGTPSEVAFSLRKEGIKGHLNSACHCPVAKYLSKKFENRSFAVNSLDVISYIDIHREIVPLPRPVSFFIAAFDSGEEFQDLAL